MILYFAGCESEYYAEACRRAGGRNSLQSAYYLGYKKPPNAYGFPGFLLDSGGFTLRKNAEPCDVGRYLSYLNEFDVETAFNMDTLCWRESQENQALLERETRTRILPVFHYSDWVESREVGLMELADRYPYFAIAALGAPGSVERVRFYDDVFARIGTRNRIHGLGATAIDHMLRYPFYSVDSTTWINARRFGVWIEFKAGRIVKHQSARVMASLATPKITDVNALNYECDRFITQAVKAYQQFEDYCTRLWAQRGIVWT